MSKTIVGIFNNYNQAENAARQIKEYGLRTSDISIVAKERSSTTGNIDTNSGTNATMGHNTSTTAQMGGYSGAKNDNISDGVVTGGILGGLAGLLIGAGSMVIPGFGIIAAAGPITGLLSGAVTGGVVGGLVDLGIPEKSSRQYESDIKAGKILFSMKADEDKIKQVSTILRDNGAQSVDSY